MRENIKDPMKVGTKRRAGTGSVVVRGKRNAQLLFTTHRKKEGDKSCAITIRRPDGSTTKDVQEAINIVNEAFDVFYEKFGVNAPQSEKEAFFSDYFNSRNKNPLKKKASYYHVKKTPAQYIQDTATLESGTTIISDFYGDNSIRTRHSTGIYNRFCDFIRPRYSITKISEINTDMIVKSFEYETKRGLSHKTIMHYRTNMRRCMYAFFKCGLTPKYVSLPYKKYYPDVEYIKVRKHDEETALSPNKQEVPEKGNIVYAPEAKIGCTAVELDGTVLKTDEKTGTPQVSAIDKHDEASVQPDFPEEMEWRPKSKSWFGRKIEKFLHWLFDEEVSRP